MEKSEIGKEPIVRIQVIAALLTTSVSRTILRVFVDHVEEQGDDYAFPTERWATNRRVVAQLLLMEIGAFYGYPPPNLGEFLYREAKQPAPSQLMLLEEVNTELCGGSMA